jgi:hypothetical protein
MTHVLCICVNNKVEVIDKTTSELKNTDKEWIVKSLENLATPKGTKLQACSWHSGDCTGDDLKNPSRCYTADKPEFGVWVEGYTAYDTCWIHEQKFTDARKNEIANCDRIIDSAIHRYEVVKEAVAMFDVNAKYLRLLEEKLESQEAALKNATKPFNKEHPDYNVLLQIRDREKAVVESRRKILLNIFERNPEGTFNDFFTRNCSEILKLEKAEENLTAWVNKHTSAPPDNIVASIVITKKEIEQASAVIKKTFKTPFSLIYLMIRDLKKVLSAYSKYQYTRPYTKDEINIHILEYKGMLFRFEKYLEGQDAGKIAADTEKEQERARKNERAIKSANTIHKIESSSFFVPIVKQDGTITYENSKERFIVGATVNSFENWRVNR